MKRIIPALVLTAALGGCFGETTIDASSAEALNESVSDMVGDLQPPERARFEAAVQTLIAANRKEGMNLDQIAAALAPQIGGKTAAEVIAAADAWTAAEEKRIAEMEREKRRSELNADIRKYSAEITKLEKVIADQKVKAERGLSEFSLSNARYYWRGPSGQEYPVIEVDLSNRHARDVETVTVRGFLHKTGESKPLVEGQLRYEFPANLRAGDTRTMHFEPDVYGDWAKESLKDRDDLEISVEMVNLTYPGGEELIKTYVYRGEDPIIRLETASRRLNDAKAELDQLVSAKQPTGS